MLWFCLLNHAFLPYLIASFTNETLTRSVNKKANKQAKRPVTATYRRIERNDGIDNSVKHHIRFSFK